MNRPPIRLRYFDARGRAQFMRAYLTVRGIDFDDDRVPLDEGFASWRALRDDRLQTGPLKRLPVLHYGDELIPETYVIAGFAHRQFGDFDALDAPDRLHHDVLVSCACIDLMLPTAMLIWADAMMPRVDLGAYAQGTLGRMQRTLDVLDESLRDWGWVGNMSKRPVTVADCMLWEEIDKATALLGSHLGLDARPELEAFYRDHPAREQFLGLLAANPCQITGRPGEAAAITAIQQSLAPA